MALILISEPDLYLGMAVPLRWSERGTLIHCIVLSDMELLLRGAEKEELQYLIARYRNTLPVRSADRLLYK